MPESVKEGTTNLSVHPIWKKTENMDVVRLKKLGQFPEELIPITGNYSFSRFNMENDKTLKIIDKILEIGTGKLSEKDINIYRYNHQIVAIRVKINELNGYLNIFGIECISGYIDNIFPNVKHDIFSCVSFNTGLSIPMGYDLKEIKSKILIVANKAGLDVSGKSNIFTPTLYIIKDVTKDAEVDNILTMIPDFIQKIKVFEDMIPYPTFFVDI